MRQPAYPLNEAPSWRSAAYHAGYLFLLTIVLILPWSSGTAQGPPNTIDVLAEAFTDLTTSELGRSAPGRLMRWERPATWTTLGRFPSVVGGGSRQILNVKLMQILQAKSISQFLYVEPKVVRPVGATLDADEISMTRASSTDLQVSFDGQQIVTTYANATMEVVAAANVVVLVGERSFLLQAARSLPGVAVPSPAVFKAERCIEVTWVGTAAQGIVGALILVDDQIPALEVLNCFDRPLGRVLGVRGETGKVHRSAYAKDRGGLTAMWSAFDRSALGMIFDSELRSGMTAEDVLPRARRLVPRYFTGQYQ